MRLSTRGEYGLLALVDLALFSSGQPVQAKQIAERQGIPKQYLDQLLMMDLKKAGLVLSLRGRQGGYQGQSDAQITDIITKGKNKVPAFDGKLTKEQMGQVVAYIRELGKKH